MTLILDIGGRQADRAAGSKAERRVAPNIKRLATLFLRQELRVSVEQGEEEKEWPYG